MPNRGELRLANVVPREFVRLDDDDGDILPGKSCSSVRATWAASDDEDSGVVGLYGFVSIKLAEENQLSRTMCAMVVWMSASRDVLELLRMSFRVLRRSYLNKTLKVPSNS